MSASVAEAMAIVSALTDDQRAEFIEQFKATYCVECGGRQTDGRPCQCWNDE